MRSGTGSGPRGSWYRAVPFLLVIVLLAPPSLARHQDAGEELLRFIEALEGVRRGSDPARIQLEQSARKLLNRHDRSDAADIARYYLSLSPSALEMGLAREASFLRIREQVVEVGHVGVLPDTSWPDRRREFVEELRALGYDATHDEDLGPRARILALLARLELDQLERGGDLEEAVRARLAASIHESLATSLALFEKTGLVTPRLEPLWIQTRLLRAEGRAAEAREALSLLDGLANRVGREEYRERALLGLADLSADVGDVVAVDRLLARVATFRDPRESWPLARAHVDRLLASDMAEVALAFLADVEPTAATSREEWRGLMASCFLRLGEFDRARELLADWSGAEFPRLAKASLALAEGDPQAVLETIPAEPGRIGWSASGQVQADSLLGEAWLDLGRPDLALPHLGRAMEAARVRELADREGEGSVIGEWLGVHTVVLTARALAESGDIIGAAALVESAHARRLRAGEAPVEAQDILDWAAAYEHGLVTWAVGSDCSIVIRVTREGEAEHAMIPHGRRRLQDAVRRLRQATIAGDGGRVRELGAQLASCILPPSMRDQARETPKGRVLLLLHGPLERLPIAALRLSSSALGGRVEPLVLPGLVGDARDSEVELELDRSKWWFLGSPLGSDGALLLQEAGVELNLLARADPRATIATGHAFVRSAVVDALKGEGPLHVATHLVELPGEGNGRLSPVGLQLTGGEVFSASEVLELAPSLPLVVLSACSTGTGRYLDAEGLQGMGMAFLEGGTRNVVVTLWPISDLSARRFAMAFHHSLQRGGAPSSALADARTALRRGGAPMADWAAFRLLGRD